MMPVLQSLLMASLPALANAHAGWADPPKSFDCGMRRLAYTFGKQLLPRQGSFESLYYALNLNDPECPERFEPAAAAPAPQDDAAPAGSIFVDPAEGHDENPGTKASPLRSVQAALDAVSRRSRKAAASGTRHHVVLRSGTHFLKEPLVLGPQHSHLVLRAYAGERPVVSGGRKLEALVWEPYNVSGDANIYRANVLGQVAEAPGLHLNGERATRARYPNLPGGIEVSPGYGSMIEGSAGTWTGPQLTKYGPVVHHTDEQPEHRRNTSANNWFQQYMIGVEGLCSVYDPPVSYWCSAHPSGGGAFAFRTPSGVAINKEKLPNSPYKDTSDMVINIWRPARWENWMFEIESYDADANNFTFGRGGNQGARGENVGGDFFVENVFEELDNPGEFFFDKASGFLYLNYNGTGAPPKDMEVVVPQLKTLINVTGTQWDPVRGLEIDGLTFKSTRYTYMEPHGIPSGGDWALDRTSAVFLQGTEGTKVQNSIFERLDGNALMISGYNRYTTVQNNDFSFIGGNALISWGYTNETATSGYPYYIPRENYPDAGVDGTDGNHPRYNAILGNLAREVGLYEKQSSFYMQAKTAQSAISGNVFFNGPRAGINFNDGFGGGDDLSRNLVFSTCRESGDHGPFNSWDRQPFLTTVATGEPSMTMAWREIHHNFFIDNYSPQEGIDNDDGTNNYRSHHNFLVYGAQGMKADFGGHDNHHEGNLYAHVGQVLGVDSTLPGHEDFSRNNVAVLGGNNVGGPQCNPPRTFMENNQYFTPSGNISLCGKPLAQMQAETGMDAGSTVAALPADETILGWAKELLSIPHEVEIII